MRQTVNDNGFNPRWDMSKKYVFHLKFPDLALLRIVVMDKDLNADDFIGYCVCPVESLCSGAWRGVWRAVGCVLTAGAGYRHVHLLTEDGRPIPDATLFVHIEVRIQEGVA